MKKSLVCFLSPRVLIACIFALLCLSSVGYASPQPATDVHFCLPLNLEDMRARDSIYAATKHVLNLNVGAPRTVRMIYFLPNDRPFRQEVVDSMKVTIRQIQTFYAEQMQSHGYGNKTFRFETDAQGEPLVHRLDGQYPDSHYFTSDTFSGIYGEIRQVDLSDFLLFASQFGLSRGDEQYDAKYDLDGDGVIGFADFLIFGRSFGEGGA